MIMRLASDKMERLLGLSIKELGHNGSLWGARLDGQEEHQKTR